MYDQATIKKVIAGDMDAFSKMYSDCAPAVYDRAFSTLGDHVKAREAVRKTFLDIFHFSPKLNDPKTFDEWVYRLVNYHCGRIAQASSEKEKPSLDLIWEEIEEIVDIRQMSLPIEILSPPAEQAIEKESQEKILPKEEKNKKNKKIVTEEKEKEKETEKDKEIEKEIEEVQTEKAQAVWDPILFPTEEGETLLRMPSESPVKFIDSKNNNVTMLSEDFSSEFIPNISRFDKERVSADLLVSVEENSSFEELSGPAYIQPSEPILVGPPEAAAALSVKSLPTREPPKPQTEHKIVVETAQAPRRPNISYERVPYDYHPYDEQVQSVYENITLTESPQGVYERVPYERTNEYKAPHASYEKISLSEKKEHKSEEKIAVKAEESPQNEINLTVKEQKTSKTKTIAIVAIVVVAIAAVGIYAASYFGII